MNINEVGQLEVGDGTLVELEIEANPLHTWQQKVAEAQAILAEELINYEQRMTDAGAPNIRFVHKYTSKAKKAIAQHTADLIAAVIGEDEKPKWIDPDSGPRHSDTCWLCYGDDYCIHEIRDALRAEQRQKYQDMRGSSNGQ